MTDITKLALLAGAGDYEAFTELYNEEQTIVSKWVARRAFVSDQADIEQDIWLHVWKGLPNFKGSSDFTTWLLSLMYNRYVDFVRRDTRYKRLASPVKLDTKYMQEMDYCNDLIAKLPHKLWRDAVTRRYILGLGFAEIGKITGETSETIRSRCRRGIAWFRAHPELY